MKSCLAILVCLVAAAPGVAQVRTITGTAADCSGGLSEGFGCHEVRLLSKLSPADLNTNYVNDVWGWADPASGREFALAGTWSHVAFVEVTDPVNPIFIGTLPSYDPGAQSSWRDMKVFKDHMFVVVDGRGANGIQVFDLTNLLAPPSVPYQFTETAHYDGIGQAHNIVINEATGFAYAVGSQRHSNNACPYGLHMVDINDPQTPTYAGCFRDTETGRGRGYSHDAQCVIYDGPDQDYVGKEICIGFNEDAISISDVTDKDAPIDVAKASYPDVRYTHQGWLTPDHKYVVQNDELDEGQLLGPNGRGRGTRTLIWDIIELEDPILLKEYWGVARSRDHNLYVLGQYVFMANYTSGLRVVDISSPRRPKEVAHFDTHPSDDNINYNGAWTAYPFLPSGTVLVNSNPEGLFMVSPVGLTVTASEADAPLPESFALDAAYPNPFNPSTFVTVSVPAAQDIDVRVYDGLGREVAVLHSGLLPAGSHVLQFEGSRLTSGTYLIRAVSESVTKTQSVTLVK